MNLRELTEELGVSSIGDLKTALHKRGLSPPAEEDDLPEEHERFLREWVQQQKDVLQTEPDLRETPRKEPESKVQQKHVRTWKEVIAHARKERKKKRRGSSATIGILGFSGSGKTAYLYVLGDVAQQTKLGSWEIVLADDAYLMFVKKIGKQLDDDFRKTRPDDPQDVFPMFTLQRGFGPLKRQVEVKCSDPSGELMHDVLIEGEDLRRYHNVEIVNALRENISTSDGFLILVDSEIAGDPRLAGSVREMNEQWFELFNRLVQIDGRAFSWKIGRPVAVVLNKADCYGGTVVEEGHDDLRLRTLIEARKNPNRREEYQKLKLETLPSRKDAARQFVETWFEVVYAQTLRVKRRTQNLAFFAITCWGRPPRQRPPIGEKGPVVVGSDIYPTCIDEPLEWLVNKVYDRYLKARRRRLLLRAVAFVAFLWALFVGATWVVPWQATRLADSQQPDTAATWLSVVNNPTTRLFHFLALRDARARVNRSTVAVGTAFLQQGDKRAGEGNRTLALNSYEGAIRVLQNLGSESNPIQQKAATKIVDVMLLQADEALKSNNPDREEELTTAALKMSQQYKLPRKVEILQAFFDRRDAKSCLQITGGDHKGGFFLAERTLAWLQDVVSESSFIEFRQKILAVTCEHVRALSRQSKYEEAETIVESIPKWLRPTMEDIRQVDELYAELHCDWAQYLVSHEEFDAAESHYGVAGSSSDKDQVAGKAVKCFCGKAESCLGARNYAVAKGALKYARHFADSSTTMTINKLDARIRFLEGRDFLVKGNAASATRSLGDAVRLDPDNRETRRHFAHAMAVEGMVFIRYKSKSGTGFYLDKYEVSNAAYFRFLKDVSTTKPIPFADPRETAGRDLYDRYSDGDSAPVVFVSWEDAHECAKYVGKRLPTEEEWELAVGDETFPRGSTFEKDYYNTRETLYGKAARADFSQFSGDRSTATGVCHLAGNVSEWVSKHGYDEKGNDAFIIKGGNYMFDSSWAEKTHRFVKDRSSRLPYVGFRCACDPLPDLDVSEKEALPAK